MAYGRVRSALHRQKSDFNTLVLSGPELREFKALAVYATTASHLSFVERAGLKRILVHCGLPTERWSAAPTSLPREAATLATARGRTPPIAEVLEPCKQVTGTNPAGTLRMHVHQARRVRAKIGRRVY